MVTKTAIDSRRWLALILLCATQFMFVLDVSIINVALPSMQSAFDFSQQNLQWVINAYTLAFGGFLLLGGRAGDLLGHRRVFIVGLTLFSLASLMGGLATSGAMLITARSLQGLGAALSSPTALSILTMTFTEGSERNRALGVWGATGASGGAAGVLLGGILTGMLGWEWVLFVNVPIAGAAALFAPTLLNETVTKKDSRQFDLAGAFCSTTGLILLVFTIVNAEGHLGRTLGLLLLCVLLFVGFIIIEQRSPAPLVPLRIFRLRNLTGANLVTLVHGTGPLCTLFFISLYLQQVLGLSALNSGLAFLPFALAGGASSGFASVMVNRFGVKPVLTAGMLLMAIGLVLFAQVAVGGSYLIHVLPASLIVGASAGLSFVPLTIAAFMSVKDEDAGLASGLLATSQQVGAAIVLALLVAIASAHTKGIIAAQGNSPEVLVSALTQGFQSAFYLGAGLVALGAIVAFLVIQQQTKYSRLE
ncbi:MFS transporter [Nostoc sp. UHCC 0302]|uniref:MFS transporter n=1 Tax=Nostoc sp. UHCC 0302 TaxID=3134896 RepID=UPI00311CB3AA